MLHLLSFCLLLAVALAQNGYEYNRPGRPFRPGFSSTRPYPSGPSSNFPTTTPFSIQPQTDGYSSSTPGYQTGTSGYPSSPGYSTSQRPQTEFSGPSYSGPQSQGLNGPSGYPVQGSSYPSGPGNQPSGPGGYPGQSGSSFPGQPIGPTSDYPSQTGSYPGRDSASFPGLGGSFPGQGGRRPSNSFQGSRFTGRPSSPGYNPGSYSPGFGPDDTGAYVGGDYSAIPGQPDIDYPVLSEIPQTSFSCNSQQYPGYYADVETRCQVFHVCANNRTYDFLCPNGTVFSQEVFVCVWWNQFECNTAPSLYGLNANLYDYSITGSQNGFPGTGFGYPQNQGGQGFPGRGPQSPLNNYQSQGQGPSSNYPGGPAYPGSTGPQGPGSFPGSSGLQSSTSGYPGSSQGYPSGPGLSSSTDYPGTEGTRGPSSYPSTTSSRPSTTYPGSGSTGYPGSFPGSSGPFGSSTPYPGSTGTRGPSSTYPDSGQNYPGSGPGSNYPGSNQGYPSGKPRGPPFPNGNRGRPQQPNREYLPPRN